ncbi:MAG: NAD(P)/FAD-dependent oxidoreductase [Sumerlaeia bacterium]
MPETEYDLIVIGSGVASSPAKRCAAEGWKVALVESRPLGGTCALRGCSPKKMLRAGAQAMDWIRRMEGRSLVAPGAHLDWQAMREFKNTFTDPVPETDAKRYAEANVDVYHGWGCFAGRNTIRVRSDDSSERTLSARKILLATGGKPRPLNFPGADCLTSSDDFFDLPELPRRVTFAGGGYISWEFAHIAARCGADVTVIDSHEVPLSGFDAELVRRLVDYSREELGIRFIPNRRVCEIRREDGAYTVCTNDTANRESQTLATDLVVHGMGRIPFISALNLEEGGVAFGPRGIEVNEYLQSPTNPAVYAAGDCTATPGAPLTPVAGAEAAAVFHNLMHGNERTVSYKATASAAFTIPEIAGVGITEVQAREQGLAFTCNRGDSSQWFSQRHRNEPCAGYAIVIEEGSRRILGAHLLGPHAAETINVFALALGCGTPVPELRRVRWAYPTSASDISSMLR